MRVIQLSVTNFRGIRSLEWTCSEPIVCLIGPGDTGKTTVLDAIEWALSPRWNLAASDADFHDSNIDAPIIIEATVAEVPAHLLTDQTYIQHARYHCTVGVHDEPIHEEDAPVLTVRLTIDAELEPEWELVCGERLPPRPISNRHRASLGVTRLGTEPDRHLRWTRGSVLERLTEGTTEAAKALTAAYRSARQGVTPQDLESLDDAVQIAGQAVPSFGAGIDAAAVAAAIDPAAFTPLAGALALHSGAVPLRAMGLGTRRLAALALQAAAVAEGAIVLMDEVEAGLEPHRLRHLLRLLRARVTGEESDGPAPAQVIMTTHSPIAVVEMRASELGVARRDAEATVTVRQPPDDLQGVIRSQPEAVLARSVIVGEGLTEHGLVRGLDHAWSADGGPPLAHRGVAIVSGGGCTKAPNVAIQLAQLGYRAAVLVDSDQPIVPGAEELKAHGVHVAQWHGIVCTEERLALDLDLPTLRRVLELIADEGPGVGQIRGDVASGLGGDPHGLPEPIAQWPGEVEEAAFRSAVGSAMSKGKWIKQVAIAELVGRIVAPAIGESEETDLATTVRALRQWGHGA